MPGIWEPILSAITVIASALISLISALISQHLSRKMAKEVSADEAKHEIEKVKFTWQHEMNATRQKDFSDMITGVYAFLQNRTTTNYLRSLEKINVLRIKETGKIAQYLDLLYYEVDVGPDNTPVDYVKIEQLLAKIVDKYREDRSCEACDDNK